jgi:hypothetical protein
MATRNDITGDAIQSRVISDTYRNNYDLIFRKKKQNDPETSADPVQPTTDSTEQPTGNTDAPDIGGTRPS